MSYSTNEKVQYEKNKESKRLQYSYDKWRKRGAAQIRPQGEYEEQNDEEISDSLC